MKDHEAVFLDLETTGLDPIKEEIIELGIARVDTRSWSVVESHSAVIWTDEIQSRLEGDTLGEFIVKMHTRSGLLPELKDLFNRGVETRTYEDAEESVLSVVKGWGAKRTPIWGSSVHFDRKFLEQKMPKLNEFFHYRNVDSSSEMERLKVKNPQIWKSIDNDESKYQGTSADHRVMEDILHSIDMERRFDKWVTQPAASVLLLPGA